MSETATYEHNVDMNFNNHDFERKVAGTIKSLNLLRETLNFKDSVGSFDEVARSINNLNVEKASSSLENLNLSFKSLLKTAKNVYVIKKAEEAFKSLGNTFAQTVKSMSGFDMAKMGWSKYAEKTTAVQTIVAATGKSISEVDKALSKLNWYSDETSYSFSDMVNTIGKFTSTGVDLNDAVDAMMGLSNWAATSGQDAATATRATYNLAQAVSAGAVKMQDWRSIQMINMSTKEFKETAIETALALGKLKKSGSDYYTTIGKKQKVTVANFDTTLSTGWFDSKTLIETLKRYSQFTDKVYEFIQTYHKEHPEEDFLTVDQAIKKMGDSADTLGKKWLRSAQEAKTYKDVIDSVKDAVSTGWMNTFELIFGNYEEARLLWTDLANELYELFANPGNNRNALLEEVMTSSYKKLSDAAEEAGISMKDFETELENVMNSTEDGKKSFESLIDQYGNLSMALNSGQVSSFFISQAIDNLVGSTKNAEKTIPTLEEVQQIVKDTFATNKYGVGKERVDAYEALGYDPVKMQKLVNKFSHTGKITLKDLEEVGIDVGKTYSETWDQFVKDNEELINSLDQLSGRELAIRSFWNVFHNVTDVIGAVKDGLGSVFNITPESLKTGLQNIFKFTNALRLEEGGVERIKTLVESMATPFKSVANISKRFIDAVIGNSIEKRIPQLKQRFTDTFNSFYGFWVRTSKLFKSLETSAYVNKFITQSSLKIRKFASDAITWYQNARDGAQKALSGFFAVKQFNNFKRTISNLWKSTYADGKNTLDRIVETFKSLKKIWKDLYGENANLSPFGVLKTIFEEGYKKLKADFEASKVGQLLMPIWNAISKAIENFKSSKLGTALAEHIKKIFDPANRLSKKGIKGSADPIGLIGIFSNITQSVVKSINTLKTVFKRNSLSQVIKKFKDSFSLGFGEFQESRFGKNLPFFESIKNGIKTFKRSLSSLVSGRRRPDSKAGDIAKKIENEVSGKSLLSLKNIRGAIVNDTAMGYLNRIPEMFGRLRDKIAVKVDSIKNKVNEVWTSYKQTGLYKTLNDFWNWSRPLLKTLTEKMVNGFSYSAVADVFKSLAMFNASKLAKSVGDFVKEIKKEVKSAKIFDSFVTNFTTFTGSLSKHLESSTLPNAMSVFTNGLAEALKPLTDQLKAENRELNARAFLEIAAGISVVAGALWLLSKVPMEQLRDPSIIVAGIGGAITGIMLALNKIGTTTFEPAAYGQILAMSLALILISAAVRNLVKAATELKGFNLEQIGIAIGGVIALMSSSLGAIHLVRKTHVFHAVSLVFSLLALAAAIRLMVSSVVSLSKLNWKEALVGVGSVVAIIMALSGGLALIGVGPAFMGTAFAILAMAGAVRILVQAVLELQVLSAERDTFARSITAIIGLIGALGVAVLAAGWGPANLFGGPALSILALAAAVRIMVGAVRDFSVLAKNKEEFESSITAIMQLLGSLSGAVFKTGWSFANFGKAATVFAFVAAIYTLQGAVKAFEKIKPGDLFKSVEAINQLMWALAKSSARSGLTLNGFGASMTVLALAKAIQWIADAVQIVSQLSANRERLDNAVQIVEDTLWALTGITVMLGAFNALHMGATFSQAATIVALALSVRMIGETLQNLSGINPERLKNAGIVVGAIMVVMGLVVGLTGLVGTEKIKGIGSFAMLTGFANAVATMANTLIKLSELDSDAAIKGGIALAGIVLALTIVIRTISKNPIDGNSKAFRMNFIAFSAGLAIMAFVIEKLGEMDRKKLIQGGLVIGALMLVLSLATVLSSKMNKMASFEGAATAGAMAASVLILAIAVAQIAKVPEKDVLRAAAIVVGLIVAIAAVGHLTKMVGSDIKSAVAITIIAAAVAGLAFAAKTFASMEWGDLGKVGASLAGMIAAMWAISTLVKIGTQAISLGAIAKLGVAIGIIGAFLAGFGALFQIEGVKNAVHAGGDFLMELGRALGGFFGAIIGGFNEGVAQSMPAIGSAMAGFAEKAEPFFKMLETYKDINPLEAIQKLSDSLSDTVWADFWARLTRGLKDDKNAEGESIKVFESLTAFGNSIAQLAPNMTTFIDTFKDLPEEKLDPVERVVTMISTLGEVTKGVRLTTLTTFANDLDSASGKLLTGITTWNSLPTPNDNAQDIADFLNTLSEVELKPSGGLITAFASYRDSFTQFANDLARSVTSVDKLDEDGNVIGKESLTFADAISGWNNIPMPNGNAEAIATFIQSILDIKPPASGGFIGDVWADYSTAFTDFASDIASSVPKLQEFIEKVSAIEDDKWDKTKVEDMIGLINSMVVTVDAIDPAKTGGYATGLNTITSEFITANQDINQLAGEISQSNLELVKSLLSFFDGSKTLDTTFINSIPGAISSFTTQLEGLTIDENITAGLTSIADALTNQDKYSGTYFTTLGSDVNNGIGQIAGAKDFLKNAREVAAFVTTFAGSATRFQKNFDSDKFAEAFGSILETVKTKSGEYSDKDFKIDKLYNFFDAIRTIYTLNFNTGEDALGRNPANKIAAAFNAISEAIDNFNPATDVTDLEGYMTWIEGLSGKKSTFETAAEALNAFAVDKDKMTTLTDFINSLKGQFVEASAQKIGWFDEHGYFVRLAEDLVTFGSELNENTDFAGLDEWKNHLNAFTAVLVSMKNLDPKQLSQKLTDILSGIRNALLGDTSTETKGIADINEMITPVFDTLAKLQEFKDNELQNIVPDILTGISTAINEFDYTEANLQRLQTAITGIAEALGLLNPETGLPYGFQLIPENVKNGLKGGNAPQKYPARRRPDSRAEEIARKIETDTGPYSQREHASREYMKKLGEGVNSVDKESMGEFVKSIGDAIESNSGLITESAHKVAENIILVFEEYYDKFHKVGFMFVSKIANGMRDNIGEAMSASAVIGANMISSFESSVVNASDSGKKFVNGITEGIKSEESYESIQNAINSLFIPSEGEVQQEGMEFSPGRAFGEQFVNDFSEGLASLGEDPLSPVKTALEAFDLSTISETLTAKADEAVATISEPVSLIESTLAAAVPDGGGLANAMIDGIINALHARVEEACAEMAAFAFAMAESARTALGIHSPSKVFYAIGENVVTGFTNAIDDGNAESQRSMRDLVSIPFDQLVQLQTMLRKFGSATYNGKYFSRKDLPMIKKYIKSLKDAEKNKNQKASSSGDGDGNKKKSGGGGGGGGGSSTKDEDKKDDSKVSKIFDFFGLNLTKEQIKAFFKTGNNMGGDFVFWGHTYTQEDLQKIQKEITGSDDKELIEYLSDVFKGSDNSKGNKVKGSLNIDEDGFTGGLMDLSHSITGAFEDTSESTQATIESASEDISSVLHELLTATESQNRTKLDPVVDSALKEHTESIFDSLKTKGTTAKGAIGAAAGIAIAKNASKKTDSKSITYNFTQNNRSPKAISKSEVYRGTKNLFSQLKNLNS